MNTAAFGNERLAHLIVTVMVVLCELFAVELVLLHPELGIVPAVIMLGLAVLLVILLPTLLLIEEDGPAVVPDRGGDAREAERRVAIHDKGLANPELIR